MCLLQVTQMIKMIQRLFQQLSTYLSSEIYRLSWKERPRYIVTVFELQLPALRVFTDSSIWFAVSMSLPSNQTLWIVSFTFCRWIDRFLPGICLPLSGVINTILSKCYVV